MKKRILIVEDDDDIASIERDYLEVGGYEVKVEENGTAGLTEALTGEYDLILLDIMLPGMDGLSLCETIRRDDSDIGIIIVSAKGQESDKIRGLSIGADDYITKPFSVDELLAHIRVAVRRLQYIHENTEKASPEFKNGGLSIDYNACLVTVNGEEVHLTPIEYKLLCIMAQNIGRVLTHNFILKEVWNNTLPNDTQSLRVYMASLRAKIEPALGDKIIQTHVGIGYRMIRL